MIELARASRWYGQVIGINDITFSVGAGITALLGPNGAGKSTVLKLVTGQLRPSSGSVSVFGKRPFANPGVLRQVGYCPEVENCYEDMSGRAFIELMDVLAGLPPRGRADRVNSSMERTGILYAAERKVGGYSKGMRQRLKVSQAILHDPAVLILDEPLNGLDPVGRREMSILFQGLAAEGKCVVVSSHILYEVEQLTHSILLMHRGRLRAQGDIYGIRSLIDLHPHHVLIRCDRPRDLARALLAETYVISAKVDEAAGGSVEIETRAPDALYRALPDIVIGLGVVVAAFESPDNNLEAVFRYLVNE